MIEMRFRCPRCKELVTFLGKEGEKRIAACPACGYEAKLTFTAPQVSTGEYAIEVSHLVKQYKDLLAVNDISFNVKKGEIFAFLGPNGAGKTTTVEIIESIRKPTAGSIRILGKDIKTQFKDVKEFIGILPQEFHSFERLTVRETLLYFSMLYKQRADIEDILKAMDLTEHANKLYRNLSGGLKQRVGVAISLVNDPEIIFLDEPTTGLDPKARREVWGVVANLRRRGKTVFLTTHYMEEAEYLADHIAIIHKGKIIAEGSLDELIDRYGKGSTMHIHGCTNPDAKALLEEKGFTVSNQGNHGDLLVYIPHKGRVLEVLSDLRYDCIEYENVDIRRSNLEEVFLNLTGAKLTEEAQ